MNPRLRGWLLLLAAVLAEVTGSISMKAASTIRVSTISGIATPVPSSCSAESCAWGALGVAYGTWAAAGVTHRDRLRRAVR